MVRPMLDETRQVILTCDPGFVDMALQELHAVDARAEVEAEVAPGVLVALGSRSFAVLAAAWRAKPPVFVRHICPVHAALALTGEADDVGRLDGVAAGELAIEVDPGRSFSVQCRVLGKFGYKPFDVNTRLAETVHAISGAALDVRSPQQVLSVVCTEMTGRDGAVKAVRRAGLLGLSRTEDNLSDWAGGVRRYAREEGQVSRAEFKLLEALEVFEIDLPPRGVALDLGAAPGGWTRVLRQRGQYVTAVDPAELDIRVAQDRGVRHKRMTAEAYLAEEPERFDVIVNDMRMDGRDSAHLMARYAGRLHVGGTALMTVKLPQVGREAILEQALEILCKAYGIAGARQLFHNRSEVTVWLRGKEQ